MSVKIEILDYKYGSGANLVDVNEASSGLSSGWTAASSTNATWDGSGSGITYLNNISSQSLVIGRTYNLSFKIYGYTGTGNMGFSTSSGVPSTARFAGNTIGIQYFTFVATGTSFPDLFGRSTNSGNISSISIQKANVVDWENSIVGELDITDHSDFPLAMTFQISDFKDITSTSGDYSKTFKIPATKNNNQIFKNLYIANIDVNNKVTSKKQCRILANNLYSKVGLIQVNSVSGYGETPSHYDCVFFGNNLTWATGIEEAYMSDIEWGAEGEGLTYNKNSIVATWQHEDSDNSSKSPIVYPITSYGVYNAGGDERTIQLLDTALDAGKGLGAGYFGFNENLSPSTRSYETPVPSADWRPTIFVKQTLEKIFAGLGGGYKISSSFMNTSMFKKLVWSLPNFQYNNASQRLIEYSYGNHFTGVGRINRSPSVGSFLIDPPSNNSYQNFNFLINLNYSTGFVLNTDTDNTGWDSVTGIYTVQEYGFHQTILNNFALFATRSNYSGGSLDVATVRINLQVKTVGQTTWNTIDYIDTGSFYDSGASTPIEIEPDAVQRFAGGIDNTTYLNKGDQLRLVLYARARTAGYDDNEISLYLFASSTPTSTTTSGSANGNYTINIAPEYVEYGQTYDLSEVISTDIKQIDFIKGIAHAFNLQMTTNSESKIVYIEPFNDFYKPLKDAIDWTHKLDRSKVISDKWLKTDLKRIMTFKYKSDDADAKVKYRGEKFFNDIQDEYPYRETLPDTFERGETTFENPFFAGTYNAKDNDTTVVPNINTAYSACLWTENVSSNDAGRPDKGFGFLPRLLYWNKYSPASSVNLDKHAFVQTWSNYGKYIIANQQATSFYLSGIYPQATMINRDSNTSPVLSYGNIPVQNYDDATGVYGAGETGSGLYETYYRNSVEMLKSNPRIRNVYINLKISDIVNLDFTKLIYIDGVYWRISKVSDYMPNKNESTKVELIEWITSLVYPYNAPIFSGRPRNWARPPSSPNPPPVKNLGL
tara:strand:- start:193 stop:3177 length:2985 start_codon:yes stop_codon:yes gene_type:complete